jgi:hypothetical protein
LEEFGFPIENPNENVQMKNINLSSLPKFRGMVYEDLETFLFEFEVLCHIYDYS